LRFKQRRARSLLSFENLVEAFRDLAPLLCHGFESGREHVKLREPSVQAFTLSGTVGEPSIRFPGKSPAGSCVFVGTTLTQINAGIVMLARVSIVLDPGGAKS
jgi:hypothetical protein